MFEVIKGKEGANVNNVLLYQATQEQLRELYELNHPFIKKVNKPKKSKKDDGKDK